MKRCKEFNLVKVAAAVSDLEVNSLGVIVLEWLKAAYIERLEEV